MGKRGPAISHHPGCTVPAQAPRAQHVEGCPYRQPRSGKNKKPYTRIRPSMSAEEAAALARARERGVDVVKALDEAPSQE